jgi:ATP-binding cassette subfamily C (CFTR/MRP) protein 4
MTLVGERGLKLSGGQKVRIALARAIYANSETLLLDDPFSSIDYKVSKKIFHNLMRNTIHRKTVILVTHRIEYLEKCDKIIKMESGRAKEIPSVSSDC